MQENTVDKRPFWPQTLSVYKRKERVTGETQDEWIAVVDLASSFHVLSYSMAATPVGGEGKQEVERGRQSQTECLKDCGGADLCSLHGKKKHPLNNSL